MIMHRQILSTLSTWAKSNPRKPLLLRGARQIGKTFVIQELAKQFSSFVMIDFELEPQLKTCFNTLVPNEIIQAISIIKSTPIIPGETLLFLDEIQDCPNAIQALRYFKEKLPALHVIAAGSLLEFALHSEEISMPVGRIEYLYMTPCSFDEYLQNSGQEQARDLLNQATLRNPPSQAVHKYLLSLFQKFVITGGMPEALNAWIDTGDWLTVQRAQNSLLQTYRDDFGKYATFAEQVYLQTVYDKVPSMIGTQITYSKIDPDAKSRDLKRAITLLEYAGLVKHIYATTASGLPLSATMNEKKFKLHFLDSGLVQRKTGISPLTLLQEDFSQINQGALAEQVVAQELLTYQDPFVPQELFFWARDAKNAQAEVDFILNIDSKIIPIEVKSSATGKLKSLLLLMQERNLSIGIKISTAPLGQDGAVVNIPFYMIKQLVTQLGQLI